jgi:hypothetical protein
MEIEEILDIGVIVYSMFLDEFFEFGDLVEEG